MGDDWLIAVGVVLVLAGTAELAHHRVHAWWLLPLAVPVVLAWSLRRAVRSRSS